LTIYLVIFGKPRYLGIVEIPDIVPEKGSSIIIDTMRGTEMGIVAGPITEVQEEKFRAACSVEPQEGQAKGGEPLLQNVTFNSLPAREDFQAMDEERQEEKAVLIKARELLREHELQMKLVDVEFLLDRKKLFFYFTSEQRVDFRAYVRDLAREFKTRIELRQIGVRDEAKAVKGLGPCGQPCCCSYWLHSFTPICIKMVKEQNLALNPTKISGICGRLMCCMSYEHQNYKEIWNSLPNPGTKIKSAKGNFILTGIELSKNCARIRSPEGAELNVPLEDFGSFRGRVLQGEEWEDLLYKAKPVPPLEQEKFQFPSAVSEIPAEVRKKKEGGPRKKPRGNESGSRSETKETPVKTEKGKPSQGRKKKRKKPGKSGKPGKTPKTGSPLEEGVKKPHPSQGKFKSRKGKKGKPGNKNRKPGQGSAPSEKGKPKDQGN